MTSFGWKRKIGEKVSKEAATKFQVGAAAEGGSGDAGNRGDNLWDSFAKKRKVMLLEDAVSKSQRLKSEGEILAEAGRHWEAITKWDEALQFAPGNEELHEMKAQVLMALHEVFPAVQAAQQAVICSPRWWVAYQTLGRAQLGLGEITMAIKSFSHALRINPCEAELWEEDLRWACSLRDQLTAKRKAQPKVRDLKAARQSNKATPEEGTANAQKSFSQLNNVQPDYRAVETEESSSQSTSASTPTSSACLESCEMFREGHIGSCLLPRENNSTNAAQSMERLAIDSTLRIIPDSKSSTEGYS